MRASAIPGSRVTVEKGCSLISRRRRIDFGDKIKSSEGVSPAIRVGRARQRSGETASHDLGPIRAGVEAINPFW